MVVPYYAVKCNPNPGVLQTLARLGTGFDCASKNEIDTVMGMGVTQDRILFANPCKMESQIMHAREVNVKRMTFDNADELRKIARLYPDAQLILRIITDDSHSMCRFSVKFGASMKDVPSLLKLAVELELDLMGVCFVPSTHHFDVEKQNVFGLIPKLHDLLAGPVEAALAPPIFLFYFFLQSITFISCHIVISPLNIFPPSLFPLPPFYTIYIIPQIYSKSILFYIFHSHKY